jgi:hypothetical protein
MMYLLIGNREDPCCELVQELLEHRGKRVWIVNNPMGHPVRFGWRLDNVTSASHVALPGSHEICDNQIEGVLVRDVSWDSLADLAPTDQAYMQSEMQAGLLAWLWSLSCPVVNRYPAHVWFHQQDQLLFWQPILWRCGLPALETVVTNVEIDVPALSERFASSGKAVYAPLTSRTRYLVESGEDWAGVATMQAYAPVALNPPQRNEQLACVVGTNVVWEGLPGSSFTALKPAMVRFAAEAGLTYVEMRLASTTLGTRVTVINAFPRFELFGESARREIASALTHLLLDENAGGTVWPN